MSEGRKDDDNKPRFNLIPWDAVWEVAWVLTFGAKKYEDRNWERGLSWGRLSSAAFRHLSAWEKGEDEDPEWGLSHLAHAACCILMLLALTLRGVGEDDRSVYTSRTEER